MAEIANCYLLPSTFGGRVWGGGNKRRRAQTDICLPVIENWALRVEHSTLLCLEFLGFTLFTPFRPPL